jgi:hypothetical protein
MFAGFLEYTEEEFKELWEQAIFVVDTNVLINFYKYTNKETTQNLFDILKELKKANRLWIPHQVALEYFFNYENNMYKQNEGYHLLGEKLKNLKEDAKKIFNQVQSEYPYINTDNFQFFIENLEQSCEKLQKQLDKEIKSLPDAEAIKNDLLELMSGIIGEPYDQKRINEIEKEGEERYHHNVPPGFKDKDDRNKQGFRTYGGIRYQQLYGDLIVWNQMIDKAREKDKKRPIIFITEEKKEDWWEKDGSKIKRPHPHLIQEFLEKTGQKFYMYRTDSFVQYAKKYLGANVTDEQIQNVTEQVENIRKVDELKEKKHRTKIDIDKVLQWLTDDEKARFNKMLSDSYDLELNPDVATFKYNRAIEWALRVSVTKMEDKLLELISIMASFHSGYAHEAQQIYNNLPEDLNKRAIILLETIKRLEDRIAFYEVQGY